MACLSGASLPAPYLSKDRGEKLLLENAEKALDYLERIAPEHPQCEFGFNIALQYIATARNWDRAVALLPKAKPGFNFLSQLLENSRHPSMADKMLDMVIAGEAETMNFRGLMTELPKRVRPDMAPKILESIPKTTGRNRSTLLSALGRTADPRGWDILEREIFNDLPNAAQAAEILEYFPGERALVALRKLLKSTNYQGFPHAARILADRGDHSGIPALIERLQTTTVDVEKRWYMGALAAIRGQSLPKLADYSTPPNTGVFLDEYWAWWQKNKSRSRVEWLLESLEEGLGVSPYPPHPLLILAQEDVRDVPADWPEERRRNEIVKRVRAWIAKTGFAFTKDNVRVHEPAKRELGR